MSNIVIPDGGNIGSASDPDAISIASSGKPTFSQGIANTGTIDAGTLGPSIVFPAGNSYYVSTFTDAFDDSSNVTVTTAGYGFGTVVGPISVANNIRMRMHIIGGMVEYDSGDSFGSCVNYHTSTFSTATTGTFDTLNFTNAPASKLTSVYCMTDYSNTSGSTVTIYFRQGFTSAVTQTARWYSNSGTGQGKIRKWYELIQI